MAHKALTFIHLPYIEKSFSPGDMVPEDDLQAYAEEAAKFDDNFPGLTDFISQWKKEGVLGGKDDDLHPDHQPVEPGAVSVEGLEAYAKNLAEQLKAEGKEVPAEVKKFISSGDNGKGVSQ